MGLSGRIHRKLSRMLSSMLHPDAVADTLFVDMAYRLILRRPADSEGRAFYLDHLAQGMMTRQQVISAMVDSHEFVELAPTDLNLSLHKSRRQWIAGLPPARRILDLGGSAKDSPAGALVFMGYPYHFEQLTILDLPFEDRHRLAVDGYQEVHAHVSPQGPVRYIYGSMTDLDQFEDDSMDMVHSGQSIEHITQDEAWVVLEHSLRIVKPGGWLCLDTPNRAATGLESEDWIHAEHKIEYTHPQLSAMIRKAGFEIKEAKGLNYMPQSMATDSYDPAEPASNPGIYDDIAKCYLLAYRCQKAAKRTMAAITPSG